MGATSSSFSKGIRPALLLCASLSLAAHAWLLESLRAAPVLPKTHQQTRATAAIQSTTLLVRTVPAGPHASAQATNATATKEDATFAETVRPVSEPQTPVALMAPAENEAAHEDMHEAAQNVAPTLAATSMASDLNTSTPSADAHTTVGPSSAPADGLTLAASGGDASPEAYIPRPELSRPPVATAPVMIPPPVGDSEVARRVAVLSLYIDEHGRVHHIVPNEPRLPPMFEAAAREAFQMAQFSPGELHGQAVKSRIRVEVVFDNTPTRSP